MFAICVPVTAVPRSHALRLQRHRRGADFDRFGKSSDLDHQVAQGDFITGVQHNVWTRQFLESCRLYTNGVGARLQPGDREISQLRLYSCRPSVSWLAR